VTRSNSYLGTGWSFPPSFIRETETVNASKEACVYPGRLVMVSDKADVEQSLEILFNTALGERVMQPTYGADLKNQMFEPMNANVLTFIKDLLRTAIIYHEPRIETKRLAVEPQHSEGRLLIEIDYHIRGTNSRFNFVYPFYLTETGQQP
jgi:phage baseplate assembly protein W